MNLGGNRHWVPLNQSSQKMKKKIILTYYYPKLR